MSTQNCKGSGAYAAKCVRNRLRPGRRHSREHLHKFWVDMGRGDPELLRSTAVPSGIERMRQALIVDAGDADSALDAWRSLYDDPDFATPGTRLNLAMWAAYLGEPELALRAMAESLRGFNSNTGLMWLSVFEETRRLPGFKVLLRELGLVDYWRERGWPDLCRLVGEQDFECR